MDTLWLALLVTAASYLLGAIPFALIVGAIFFDTDVRKYGSGNLGATNVMRVLGWRAGLVVFILDMAKGIVAVSLASILYPGGGGEGSQDWLYVGTAVFAVLGHSYSPYIGFRGGKGVATAAGALLFVTPLAWVGAFIAFVVTVAVFRMVSLGSIVSAGVHPLLCLAIYMDRPPIIALAFIAAGIVVFRLRTNFSRILKGEESKITDTRDIRSKFSETSIEDPSGGGDECERR